MASPRVFISSTCYDLGEVRDILVAFISSYDYEPILSEKGDIFYHPDLHTQESCLREVDNCQMFVLIIGGRFGGEYKADRKKSIVNAEYLAARQCGIPVFCFVKREVLDDQRLYERNKANKSVVGKIVFPSIEQQEYTSDIFEFINEVRASPVNNGIFPFDFARDIQDLIKKQWAGMTYDFLLRRRTQNELQVATGLIENLTLANTKTEELLESIYRHLDREQADRSISQLDKELEAKRFLQRVLSAFDMKKFNKASISEWLKAATDVPWYEFLIQTGDFEKLKDFSIGLSGEKSRIVDIIFPAGGGRLVCIAGDLDESERQQSEEMSSLYTSFKELSEEQKMKVIADFT